MCSGTHAASVCFCCTWLSSRVMSHYKLVKLTNSKNSAAAPTHAQKWLQVLHLNIPSVALWKDTASHKTIKWLHLQSTSCVRNVRCHAWEGNCCTAKKAEIEFFQAFTHQILSILHLWECSRFIKNGQRLLFPGFMNKNFSKRVF